MINRNHNLLMLEAANLLAKLQGGCAKAVQIETAVAAYKASATATNFDALYNLVHS